MKLRILSAALIKRAIIIVDQEEAALEETGDLLIPMAQGEWHISQLYAELDAAWFIRTVNVVYKFT